MKSRDKKPQDNEKALNSVCFSSHGFGMFPSVKTCSIFALQRVFLGQVVFWIPPQIRGIGRDPDDSQNDHLPRRRPQRHRCTPVKYCSRTTSSYGGPVLTPVRRCQGGPVVGVLVPENELKIALVSTQRQGSCEGKNAKAPGCDPYAYTASPTQLILQNVPDVGEYMLCGSDGIDTTTIFKIFRKRRRLFMRKIVDRVNIITPVIVMDRQLTIDSKLPL